MIDLEKQILGEILFEPEILSEIDIKLIPSDFSLEKHRLIFAKIVELYENKKAVDILTIFNSLKDKFDGNDLAVYLAQLQSSVSSNAYLQQHIDSLIEYNTKNALHLLSENRNSLSVDELQDQADRIFDRVNSSNSEPETTGQILNKVIEMLDKPSNFIKTGFYDLDDICPIEEPDSIILAARPGMGKTAKMLSVARNVSDNYGVLIFSMEMSKEQLMLRLISMESGVSVQRIRTKTFHPDEKAKILKSYDKIKILPIIIDDEPALTIRKIRTKTKKIKKKFNIKLVIVDYLQLMSGSGGNREAEISGISRGIKQLCKEFSLPFITLSQLNRSVESRADKKPMLSDLRESGAIEQDADAILFLYRPAYYNILTDSDGNNCSNICEIIIAKNRHGETKTIKELFIKEFTKFENLEYQF